MTWLNWVRFLVPQSFKLFRLWCYYIQLRHERWWKTLPITFRIIWLVRPITHAKYTRTLYPYIPSGFNYFGHHTVVRYKPHDRTWFGITLSVSCAEVIIFWICSACSVPACNTPAIFNVVVYLVIYHWMLVVGEEEDGPEWFFRAVQRLSEYLYADDGLLAFTRGVRLQWVIGVFKEIYDQSSMQTNTGNTVGMVWQPCRSIEGH